MRRRARERRGAERGAHGRQHARIDEAVETGKPVIRGHELDRDLALGIAERAIVEPDAIGAEDAGKDGVAFGTGAGARRGRPRAKTLGENRGLGALAHVVDRGDAALGLARRRLAPIETIGQNAHEAEPRRRIVGDGVEDRVFHRVAPGRAERAGQRFIDSRKRTLGVAASPARFESLHEIGERRRIRFGRGRGRGAALRLTLDRRGVSCRGRVLQAVERALVGRAQPLEAFGIGLRLHHLQLAGVGRAQHALGHARHHVEHLPIVERGARRRLRVAARLPLFFAHRAAS